MLQSYKISYYAEFAAIIKIYSKIFAYVQKLHIEYLVKILVITLVIK